MNLNHYAIAPGAPLAPGGASEVGNKAWNLMRMAQAGIHVPAAIVLPTSWCREYRAGRLAETSLPELLAPAIAGLETTTGLGFGCSRKPLFISVRSGAAVSMPGMLETVLDVGMNSATVDGLIRMTGNPRVAWDSYRRLVQSYAEVVLEEPQEVFDEFIAQALSRAEVETERDLDFRSLRELTHNMMEKSRALTNAPFPQDHHEQLAKAVAAVFRSWDAPKAVAYRRLNGIDDDEGTAVTIQRMVFGNAGGDSGSGIGFTRNPATGERELYIDFLLHAQGEDAVNGRHLARDGDRLRRMLPAVWKELQSTGRTLEALFRDAQDFEFTVETGTLYILQARNAKRTPWAALRVATDLAAEHLISPAEALARLEGIDLASVKRTRLASPPGAPLDRAEVASIGVASGAIALDSNSAKRLAGSGTPVILVRPDTATSDIEGMAAAAGILTATGGRTSHAAVVVRQLNKVCLVGCRSLIIDLRRRLCQIGGRTLHEGDFLSLDANEGAIYAGQLATITERPERELAAIHAWQSATSA
ncbi:MAG TPA: PEP/pyruvate-binding domain-containing protein [Bryobacteraceae bacterium]|nr:PEP/pyruvate-binding domain-containing protein [Bryobacteraceae bacterium]